MQIKTNKMKTTVTIVSIVLLTACGESEAQKQKRLQDNFKRSCDSIEVVHKLANEKEANRMLNETLRK